MNFTQVWISLFILVLVSSCAQFPRQSGQSRFPTSTDPFEEKKYDVELKARVLENYYRPSGVQKFFLPHLPLWANFSSAGQCHRKSNITYFDIPKVRQGFSLKYDEALQFQYLFNFEKNNILKGKNLKGLPVQNEERLFYTLSQRVLAGGKLFLKPKFKRVHLLWIDPFLAGKDQIRKLKRFIDSNKFAQGFPVFVSLCLNYIEMQKFIKENGLEGRSIRAFTYEIFSVFNLDNNKNYFFTLNFREFFSKRQKLYLFLPKNRKIPLELDDRLDVVRF